ncbi:MAG: CBS domain-containing protein [Proteobacteria bacterium]|jgi:magnesium and cobalt transporter|nr:CBS domain-containing protein [Pseudomonadota bacterium]
MIENDKPPSKLSFIQSLRKRIASRIFKASSLNEVSSQLEQAHLTDLIDKEAFFIADRALKLGERKTKEIMVPKIEMVTISAGEAHNNIIEKVISSGHSRFPVLGGAPNEVLGLMLAKDIIPELVNGSLLDIKKMLREIKVIPETKKLDTLLEDFKRDKSHLAVVVDEYGTISGLVTIEDVLEELVGEIEDEHDVEETDELIQVAEKEFIADAMLELPVFAETFKVDVSAIDAETLGGLFIQQLGLLPKVGDRIEFDNLILAVTAADKRKVKKIGITIKEK